jgi:hypothetical protein
MRPWFALAFAVAAAPALAAPATPEGAAALEAALRTVLGQTEGVVTVTPQGESYAATLDIAPLVALIPVPGVSFQASPSALTITELGDGRWQVDAPAGPWSMDLAVPDALALSIAFANFEWSGVWNESLAGFESSAGSASGISMTQATSVPGEPTQDVAYSVADLSFSSSAAAASGGGVDVQNRYELTGMSETISMPVPDGSPVDITLTLDSYVTDGTATGLRSRELLDLVAFLVARPSAEAMVADEAGLKAAIRAALPLWGQIDAIGTADGIAVTTPFGNGAATSMVFQVGMSGAVTAGRFREKLAVTGLQLPEALMPPWVPPLLPDDASIDVTVSGFDASAPALMALEVLSFAAPPAPDFGQMLAMAAMPNGNVTVSVAETGVAGEGFGLTIDGTLQVGPMAMPTGTATVALTGVDTIIGHLNAAPEDVRSGAVPALAMARGLAKADGDRLVWELEATPDGKMLVNGNDFSSMMQ